MSFVQFRPYMCGHAKLWLMRCQPECNLLSSGAIDKGEKQLLPTVVKLSSYIKSIMEIFYPQNIFFSSWFWYSIQGDNVVVFESLSTAVISSLLKSTPCRALFLMGKRLQDLVCCYSTNAFSSHIGWANSHQSFMCGRWQQRKKTRQG